MKYNDTFDKYKTYDEISDEYKVCGELKKKARLCYDFLLICEKYLNSGTLEVIRAKVIEFLNPNIYDDFKDFTEKNIYDGFKNEISKKAIEIAKFVQMDKNCGKNLYDITLSKYEILKKIKEHNESKIVKKHTNTKLEMSAFIKKDNKMAFYKYFNDYLISFENSQSEVHFFMIEDTFYDTYHNTSKIIDILEKEDNSIECFKKLLKEQLVNQLCCIKSNISNYIEDQIIELKMKALNELKKNFFGGIDNCYEADFELNTCFENQYYFYGLSEQGLSSYNINYRISFSDINFRKNLAFHMKNSIFKYLKELWNDKVFLTKALRQKPEDLDELLQKNICELFQKALLEMKKNINDFYYEFLPLIRKLKNSFKHYEELNKNTIKTIRNILLAESLIINDGGKFYYEYTKEVIGANSLFSMNFETFTENNKIVLPLDILRLDNYKVLIDNSKSSSTNFTDLVFNNSTMSNAIDKPFEIFKSYFEAIIIKRHDVFKKFFNIPKIEKLPLAYNICCHKFLLFKDISKPIDQNSKNYHLLIYTIENFNSDYRDDYRKYHYKIENDFYKFQKEFEKFFNESKSDEIKSDDFQKILNDANDKYFENNCINEVTTMLNFYIDDLLQRYNKIFEDINQLIANKEFCVRLKKRTFPLYYLGLLDFKKATNLIKELEKIILENVNNIPLFRHDDYKEQIILLSKE
ncbi:hypothetical protein GVAV_002063 [Gurleya vavrai]